MQKRYPDLTVLILVPTTALKNQWIEKLVENNITGNISVQVMMGASQREAKCDLLIIDEFHRAAAEIISNIFKIQN